MSQNVTESTAAEAPDLDRSIGMRNILAHEYRVVDREIVWSVVDSRLTALAQKLARLLGES